MMADVETLLPNGKAPRRDRNAHHRCEVRQGKQCEIRAEWLGTLGGRRDVLICAAHLSVLGELVQKPRRFTS